MLDYNPLSSNSSPELFQRVRSSTFAYIQDMTSIQIYYYLFCIHVLFLRQTHLYQYSLHLPEMVVHIFLRDISVVSPLPNPNLPLSFQLHLSESCFSEDQEHTLKTECITLASIGKRNLFMLVIITVLAFIALYLHSDNNLFITNLKS